MASVNDRYPAAELTITGECEARHKDEIVHRARHQEEQEKAEYPRHRIVPSRSSIALPTPASWISTMRGEAYFIRVRWSRDGCLLRAVEVAHAAVDTLKAHTSVPEGAVRPAVTNGVVTLEGEVEWQYQRDAAQAVVRGPRGVKQVINQIALKPRARPSASDIKMKIKDALKRSAQVDARRITVAATEGTVVLREPYAPTGSKRKLRQPPGRHRASLESTTGSRSPCRRTRTTTNESSMTLSST